MDYEIEMYNDGSHFSHEHYGQLPVTLIMLLVFTKFLLSTAWGFFKEMKKEEHFESPLFVLVIAVH